MQNEILEIKQYLYWLIDLNVLKIQQQNTQINYAIVTVLLSKSVVL